jgi:diguanylate cyclase (GGDEF)-like protein
VLAALKKSEKTQKIPIIFITGLSSDEDEAKGLALDAADYITKPFAAKIVKLRVRNQMQIINQMRTIERLSMIDQLTEIPNRRSFDERLFLEWNQAIREKTPISILVMDVDKFKYYNDTYGHQQGDVVLKTVAKVFSQSIRRPADFVARWGGEEFTVLLPNTVAGGAMEVAETIRAAVENTVILCADGTETKVTISIGVFTQIPEQSCTIDTFITNADEALYTAKRTGRNKVVHFSQCEPEAEG